MRLVQAGYFLSTWLLSALVLGVEMVAAGFHLWVPLAVSLVPAYAVARLVRWAWENS